MSPRTFEKCSICSWCYKTFFEWNLDFIKIKKFNKVCSNVWTITKMLKQCYFQTKLYSRTVYCFENGLFLLFQLWGKSRFSRYPAKKFYNINCWLHCFCFYRWKTAAIRRTWFVTLFLRTFFFWNLIWKIKLKLSSLLKYKNVIRRRYFYTMFIQIVIWLYLIHR